MNEPKNDHSKLRPNSIIPFLSKKSIEFMKDLHKFHNDYIVILNIIDKTTIN